MVFDYGHTNYEPTLIMNNSRDYDYGNRDRDDTRFRGGGRDRGRGDGGRDRGRGDGDRGGRGRGRRWIRGSRGRGGGHFDDRQERPQIQPEIRRDERYISQVRRSRSRSRSHHSQDQGQEFQGERFNQHEHEYGNHSHRPSSPGQDHHDIFMDREREERYRNPSPIRSAERSNHSAERPSHSSSGSGDRFREEEVNYRGRGGGGGGRGRGPRIRGRGRGRGHDRERTLAYPRYGNSGRDRSPSPERISHYGSNFRGGWRGDIYRRHIDRRLEESTTFRGNRPRRQQERVRRSPGGSAERPNRGEGSFRGVETDSISRESRDRDREVNRRDSNKRKRSPTPPPLPPSSNRDETRTKSEDPLTPGSGSNFSPASSSGETVPLGSGSVPRDPDPGREETLQPQDEDITAAQSQSSKAQRLQEAYTKFRAQQQKPSSPSCDDDVVTDVDVDVDMDVDMEQRFSTPPPPPVVQPISPAETVVSPVSDCASPVQTVVEPEVVDIEQIGVQPEVVDVEHIVVQLEGVDTDQIVVPPAAPPDSVVDVDVEQEEVETTTTCDKPNSAEPQTLPSIDNHNHQEQEQACPTSTSDNDNSSSVTLVVSPDTSYESDTERRYTLRIFSPVSSASNSPAGLILDESHVDNDNEIETSNSNVTQTAAQTFSFCYPVQGTNLNLNILNPTNNSSNSSNNHSRELNTPPPPQFLPVSSSSSPPSPPGLEITEEPNTNTHPSNNDPRPLTLALPPALPGAATAASTSTFVELEDVPPSSPPEMQPSEPYPSSAINSNSSHQSCEPSTSQFPITPSISIDPTPQQNTTQELPAHTSTSLFVNIPDSQSNQESRDNRTSTPRISVITSSSPTKEVTPPPPTPARPPLITLDDESEEMPTIRIRSDVFSNCEDPRILAIIKDLDAKAKTVTSVLVTSLVGLKDALAVTPPSVTDTLRKFHELRSTVIKSLCVLDNIHVRLESGDVLSESIPLPDNFNFGNVLRIPMEEMADYFLKILAVASYLREPACSGWVANLQMLHYRLSRVLNFYFVGGGVKDTEGNLQNILIAIKPRLAPYNISIADVTEIGDHIRTFHLKTEVDKNCVLFDQSQMGFKGFSEQLDVIVCKVRLVEYRKRKVVPPPQDSAAQNYSFENDMKILFEIRETPAQFQFPGVPPPRQPPPLPALPAP